MRSTILAPGLLCVAATVTPQSTQIAPAVLGRWDITVTPGPRAAFRSWLEIQQSGFTTLTGRFVGRIGSARPIGRVEWSEADSTFRFSIIGWTPTPFGRNNWAVRDGTLVTTASEGANLFTVERFQDFKLHVELRLPRGGDTGVFLRGRYEVQARPDTTGDWPSAVTSGAIYSVLIPNENASLGPDRWQRFDITLVGRRVTVVVNGKTVIADQIIPGLSGSALDADEGAPGPIMLQGEELTPVEFRNITISVPRVAGDQGATPSA